MLECQCDELLSELTNLRAGGRRQPHRIAGGGGGVGKAEAARAPSSSCPPPAFPYAEGSGPASVYWEWFRRALATRLRAAAATSSAGPDAVLKEPTAAGVCRTCADVFGLRLSEAEVAHLHSAPVSAEWLRGVLAAA
uniref:Uncharacterized protein n=1 Tax=Alexandrium catenella TaxID=2925 RepID=A0A7S1W8R1_ALECA|mmetsp:Transcript_43522/g.117385  ORF Transcript_43522/g.117385 Transcript_43522/m.117385 type:complete len:137 (+) Transcript_43522:118-528(+)